MSDRSDEAEFLEVLLEQERLLQFDSFTHEDAFALGLRIVQLASERSLPIATVVMLGQQRVFHVGLRGSSADNDGWLDRKVRVVQRYGHASLTVGTEFRTRDRDFDTDSRLDPGEFAAHGGAFPIRARGMLVGVAAVSGLAQRDDHAIVVEALTQQRDATGGAPRQRGRRAMA